MKPILRIALADDQALIRAAVRSLLESFGDIAVSIEAEDGAALLAALAQTKVCLLYTSRCV